MFLCFLFAIQQHLLVTRSSFTRNGITKVQLDVNFIYYHYYLRVAFHLLLKTKCPSRAQPAFSGLRENTNTRNELC